MAVNLQKEEEVKQYLENLGTEYRFGCYHEKKPEVCELLGEYLEAVKKDFEKAAKVFKNNCDENNFARSCYKFGGYSFIGQGCAVDQQASYDYFKKACDLGDSSSCLNLGLLNVTTIPQSKLDRPKDYKTGMEYLAKACEGKQQYACYYLSGMFMSGVENVLEKDMKKAFEFTEKSCSLNNMYACANLSQMYARGDGVEANATLSEKFKAKSMDLQEQAKSSVNVGFQQK